MGNRGRAGKRAGSHTDPQLSEMKGGSHPMKSILCLFVLVISLISVLLTGCDPDKTGTSGNQNGGTGDQAKTVTITIGNLTDQTGPGAHGLTYVDLALKDMVDYYNNNDLIPGVHLKMINYDTQYDAARAVPGYEKLKSDGADFIWTACPIMIPILKAHLDRDGFVAFTATANMEEDELKGGYIFSMGITPKNEAYTLLDWIAKNDESFPSDRPARVGGAAWDDGYNNLLFEAAKEYCDAHPEIYEWDTMFLTDIKFSWKTEAEHLMDCDYVFVPALPYLFMKDFREAGAEGKFLGTDPPLAFLREIGEMDLWDDIDGSLFIRSSRWYNETGPIIDIANQLLRQNYSKEKSAEIRRQGVGYLSVKQNYLMLDIVRKAVEEVGAQNFNSQALYEAATSWQYDYEGIPAFHSFTQIERIPTHYYAVYEARGDEQDVFRIHEEWLPKVDSLE